MCDQHTIEEPKKVPKEETLPTTPEGGITPPTAPDPAEERKEVPPPATGETLSAEIKPGDTSEGSTLPPPPGDTSESSTTPSTPLDS